MSETEPNNIPEEQTDEAKAWLYIQRGPLADSVVQLHPGTNVFGRDEGTVLPDPLVSRKHAKILAIGDDYIFVDLGSSNGSFLNGQKVTSPTLLQHGDAIQLGGTIMIFFIQGMKGQTITGSGAQTQATDPDRASISTMVTTQLPKLRHRQNE